jgi:hypothetical protein
MGSMLTIVFDALNGSIDEWGSSAVGVEVHYINTILAESMGVHKGANIYQQLVRENDNS